MVQTKPVLILGSAPNALDAARWDKSNFSAIVAINNAWRVRTDWDYLIHPEDFPQARRPQTWQADQTLIDAASYVPAINSCGGFVYAGGTMAFTAGYWALAHLKPRAMIFMGCDMVYDSQGQSHFYGQGAPDPLRDDITLRSLEAKSARLMAFAARSGCACMRVSPGRSRLVFPQLTSEDFDQVPMVPPQLDIQAMGRAIASEKSLGYFVESGRYWEDPSQVSTDEIDALDQMWLNTLAQAA